MDLSINQLVQTNGRHRELRRVGVLDLAGEDPSLFDRTFDSGLLPEAQEISRLPKNDLDFHPIRIKGEPLSATILRERR